MRRRLQGFPAAAGLGLLLAAGGAARWACRPARPEPEPTEWIEVGRGGFRLWTEVEGELSARNVAPVFSQVNGPATLVFLAPEGAPVRRGEIVARFDSFHIEQELNRLDRELAVAEAECTMLESALLPLERAELDAALAEAQAAWRTEAAFLEDIAELVRDGLVSGQELEQHRSKVGLLRARAEQIETRRRLTDEHLHPARLREARAKRDSALRQRDSHREQLLHTVLRAPADGDIVHVALALGGERRTARVGDVLYRNQEFLCIPDPSEWIVRVRIPEQDLSRVRPGMPAHITPRAFPGSLLEGAVETVSAMGQRDGRAPGPRHFPATLRVEAPPGGKSGLTVHVRILSRDAPDALLVPRSAVRWDEGRPAVRVWAGRGRAERREIVLGDGNEWAFEVLSGLSPGDRIAP